MIKSYMRVDDLDYHPVALLQDLHDQKFFQKIWLGSPPPDSLEMKCWLFGIDGKVLGHGALNKKIAERFGTIPNASSFAKVSMSAALSPDQAGDFGCAVTWDPFWINRGRVVEIYWSIVEPTFRVGSSRNDLTDRCLPELLEEVSRFISIMSILSLTVIPPDNLRSLSRSMEYIQTIDGESFTGAIPLPGIVSFLAQEWIGPRTDVLLDDIELSAPQCTVTRNSSGVLLELANPDVDSARALESVLLGALDEGR